MSTMIGFRVAVTDWLPSRPSAANISSNPLLQDFCDDAHLLGGGPTVEPQHGFLGSLLGSDLSLLEAPRSVQLVTLAETTPSSPPADLCLLSDRSPSVFRPPTSPSVIDEIFELQLQQNWVCTGAAYSPTRALAADMLNDALHAQTPQLAVCASPGNHQGDDTTAPSTPMADVPAVQPATVCASPRNHQGGDTSAPLPPLADVLVVQPAARTAASVASFIDSLKLPLEEPLVCTPPRARTAKNVDDDWIPRRSDRLAAMSAFRDL